MVLLIHRFNLFNLFRDRNSPFCFTKKINLALHSENTYSFISLESNPPHDLHLQLTFACCYWMLILLNSCHVLLITANAVEFIVVQRSLLKSLLWVHRNGQRQKLKSKTCFVRNVWLCRSLINGPNISPDNHHFASLLNLISVSCVQPEISRIFPLRYSEQKPSDMSRSPEIRGEHLKGHLVHLKGHRWKKNRTGTVK